MACAHAELENPLKGAPIKHLKQAKNDAARDSAQ